MLERNIPFLSIATGASHTRLTIVERLHYLRSGKAVLGTIALDLETQVPDSARKDFVLAF